LNLNENKHGLFTDEKNEEENIKTSYQHLSWVRNNYYELSKKDNLTVTEIYKSVDKYFNVNNYSKKATQKRIFNICIAPLRTLCKYHHVKKHFLKFFACAMYRYIEQDYDFVLGITGTEGTGKSACSLLLSKYLEELGMSFDLENDIFFRGDATAKGFMRAWKSISQQRKHVIIFDEGKAFFDKRQSMNATRVESLQELTSQRSKNHIIMINVGDISEIDVYFRDRRCRAILTLPDRGLGVILFNKGIIGMGGDRFNLDYFNKVLTFTRKIDYLQQISMLSELSTQYGLGSIPIVDEEIYVKYNEMKDKRNSIVDQRREYFAKKRIADEEKKLEKEETNEVKKKKKEMEETKQAVLFSGGWESPTLNDDNKQEENDEVIE